MIFRFLTLHYKNTDEKQFFAGCCFFCVFQFLKSIHFLYLFRISLLVIFTKKTMEISLKCRPWLKKYLLEEFTSDNNILRYKASDTDLLFLWSFFRKPNPGENNTYYGSPEETLKIWLPSQLVSEGRIYLDSNAQELLHKWARNRMTKLFFYESLSLKKTTGLSVKDYVNQALYIRYGFTEEDLPYETIRKGINRYADKVKKDLSQTKCNLKNL